MECPFELPIRSHKSNDGFFRIRGNNGHAICKDIVEEDEADYIVQAINSHEKFNKKIQTIISRLERNRNAERLKSEATQEPAKSFWKGQADKASEEIMWLEQALEAEKNQ